MDEIIKKKKILLALAITSLILGAFAIAGIILFILKLWYIPMAICIAVTAHGFYGCPFYFIGYSNAKKNEILLTEIKGGKSIDEAAKTAGVKLCFAAELLGKRK